VKLHTTLNPSPFKSIDDDAFRVTVSPTIAVWSGPAFAVKPCKGAASSSSHDVRPIKSEKMKR
jgi:hypothetical protein